MPKNFVEYARKEHEAYTGLTGNDGIVETIKKNKLTKDQQVLSWLDQVVKNEQELSTLISQATTMKADEFEQKYAEFHSKNKLNVTPEMKKAMDKFFSNMDQSVVKLDGWKNLYRVYLKNTLKESPTKVNEWRRKKEELNERCRRAKEGFTWEEIKNNYHTKEKMESALRKLDVDFENSDTMTGIANAKQELDNVNKNYYYNTQIITNENAPLSEKLQQMWNYYDNKMKSLKEFQNKSFDDLTKNLQTLETKLKQVRAARKEFETNEDRYESAKEYRERLKREGYLEFLEKYPEYNKRLTKEELESLKKDTGFDTTLEEKFKDVANKKEFLDCFSMSHIITSTDREKEYGEWIEKNKDKTPTYEEYEQCLADYNEEVKNVNKALYDKFQLSNLSCVILKNGYDVDHEMITVYSLKNNALKEEIKEAESIRNRFYNGIEKAKKCEQEIEKLEKSQEVKNYEANKKALKNRIEKFAQVDAEFTNIKNDYKQWKADFNEEVIHDSLSQKVKELYDDRELNKGLHSNSREYREMELAMKIVAEWSNAETRDFVQRNAKKGIPQTRQAAEKFLVEKTQAYLDAKRAQTRNNPSLLRQTRLAFAQELLRIATETKEDVDILAPDKNPQMNAEPQVNGPENQQVKETVEQLIDNVPTFRM